MDFRIAIYLIYLENKYYIFNLHITDRLKNLYLLNLYLIPKIGGKEDHKT